MSSLDIIFAVVLGSAFYKGYSRGIIRTILAVVVWIFGWMIATRLSSSVTSLLGEDMQDHKLAPVLSFIIVFVAIGFAVRYLGKIADKILSSVMLGWANRLSGALVYVFAGALICSGFAWLLDSLGIMNDSKKESVLYGYVQPLAPKFAANTHLIFPFLENSYDSISEAIDSSIPNTDNPSLNP